MVANKKSGDVMKEDLGLFLNEHTNVFVDWLVQVLEKLKKVTLGEFNDLLIHDQAQTKAQA